jgi:uncharacterized membrane protein
MNITLWIIAGLLAALFLMAGAMKLTTPKAKLLENPQMGWAEAYPAGAIKLIGAAEVAGAAGLVLPGAFDVAAWLVPTAATGLAVTMAGAALTHLRRGEVPQVVTNVVLLALAVFVAVERFGPHSF